MVCGVLVQSYGCMFIERTRRHSRCYTAHSCAWRTGCRRLRRMRLWLGVHERVVDAGVHASAAAPLAAQAEEIRIHVACLHATAGCALLCVAPWTFPNVARELKNIFPFGIEKGAPRRPACKRHGNAAHGGRWLLHNNPARGVPPPVPPKHPQFPSVDAFCPGGCQCQTCGECQGRAESQTYRRRFRVRTNQLLALSRSA